MKHFTHGSEKEQVQALLEGDADEVDSDRQPARGRPSKPQPPERPSMAEDMDLE
ncbi:hypothetical protein [Corallococcus coralloides]|uniref:hypothetical protein n=1 Tax=Corallococcus coralloides TaxID=184914 RepID=UPI0002DC3DFA|nr:hypothetical protein [Corallococcus coralloides]